MHTHLPRILRTSALATTLLGSLLLQACSQPVLGDHAAAASTPSKEHTMSLPKPSRRPPPQVDPIEHKGVRYEQETQGLRHGLDRTTGYLVAVDPASGERLWTLKVYDSGNIEHLEKDVQWIFFKSMALVEGRDELLIENEVGNRYRVDLQQRTVSPAP